MNTGMELSNDELVGIERRAQAAACGPWYSYVVGRNIEAGLNCIQLGSCETLELVGASVADQDFAAHAREDVPRLVAEVRRLRSLLGMKSRVDHQHVRQGSLHDATA